MSFIFTKVFVILSAVLIATVSSRAGTVRVAFLSDASVLRDTLAVLKHAGCTREAILTFQRAVERYNATAFEFDYSKFPKSRDSFYSFDSVSQIVSALPHKLSDTPHAYEFNCFDMVIVLANGRLRTTLRPDQITGPLLVAHTPTNGTAVMVPAATAIDAFAFIYPSWYQEITANAVPAGMRDARVSLTASLFGCHVLSSSLGDETLRNGALAALRTTWKSQGVTFPASFQIVLCHQVKLPQRIISTAHAGLLLPRKRGYTYLEKAGGSGPFVRLDLEEKGDLALWFAETFKGASKLGYSHHFATFNDTEIERFDLIE